MARGNSSGAVRGPSSALTSFLANLGVEPPRGSPYGRINAGGDNAGDNADGGDNAEAGPSSDSVPTIEEPAPAPKRKRARAWSVDSDDLDGDFTPDSVSASGTSTPAVPTPGARPGPMKSVGEFMNCGECGSKFTVTAYTKEHPKRTMTYLCTKCCPKLGIDPYAKAKKPRKAPAKKEARAKVVHYEVVKGAPALADLCIKLIGRYIEEVDALGEIGSDNLDKVCKIISKSRRLTYETATLFYSAEREELTMYDCTNLDPDAYLTLSQLCPNLVKLNLQYCGQMATDTLVAWGRQLTRLSSLELFGPFLVRREGWIEFFKARGEHLEELIVTQSPRIDLGTVDEMVKACPNLRVLKLSEIGKLEDDFLGPLADLGKLEVLAITAPGGPPLSDDAVGDLLAAIGSTLVDLDLSYNSELTDRVLGSIAQSCPNLTRLSLAHVDLTDAGVAAFFNRLKKENAPGLTHLNLEKGHDLGSAALDAIVNHSGETLHTLSLMGWRNVSAESVAALSACKNLVDLDLGWCRQVTDFTLKAILEGCDAIERIHVWGCNLLTDRVPRKRGVKVIGIETHAIK